MGVSLILSYLIGNLSPGWLIAYCKGAGDVRNQGSGATGATNTSRLLGKRWFFIILLLDVLKGALPILLLHLFFDHEAHLTDYTICGLAVITGHIWPIMLGFRGGKGIGPFIGVWLSIGFLYPPLYLTLLGPVLIGLLLLPVGKGALISALWALPSQPILLWLLTQNLHAFLTASVITLLILYAHRSNLASPLPKHENTQPDL